jgi:hypothetical protein
MQHEIKVGDTVYLKYEFTICEKLLNWLKADVGTPLEVKGIGDDGLIHIEYLGNIHFLHSSDVSTTPLTPIISDVQFEVGNG